MRELIAQRLASNRGFNASPDDVFIADGAGGSITILLDSFINPGDPVLVEEFTYMGSLRMMMERGAEPIHVPSDEDGMLPDAVDDILKSLDGEGRRAKFIWTIPVFQNPLGYTVSEARRNALLDVAERWGVPILENESYADFSHRRRPAATGNVRYAGPSRRDVRVIFYQAAGLRAAGGIRRAAAGGEGCAPARQRRESTPSQRQPSRHHAGV